ncbi:MULTISPECIES: sodium-dependent transporter [unclassified Fibrobacter]|uniref:sodium-dependent transporter n=1 Tax=unclassified Fibrobacter TaxID=2634177 RepID=UPI000D6AB5A6|nr:MULTISPECIES: sodium-dependent transporter [unclassified Fibrobacter]PWJ68225.1 SNF family Na+-dependent transporter [Fibrobacter sp. UWR4]PZW72583.1 SNF family Na+-dependent transporter [Fibrobacter sp. UWR1]
MKNKRDNWGSKLGVILAVAGSAVGLGNFLRFPVQAATNGGGSFIIPYLIAFLLLGIPLSWMEWTLGRAAGGKRHGTAPGGFHYILGKKPWAKHLGSLCILPPLFITFYYMFIQSWILAFTYYSATGKLMEVVAGGYGPMKEFFGNYIMLNTKIGPFPAAILFFLVTFACNMGLLSFGVRKGIERVNKITMPILLVMGLILVGRVLTIDGISKGLAFVWNPNLSEITNPTVWLAASGQVFFTMSLGMGIVFCYASYLKPKEDLVLSSLTAASTNGFAEIILGGTIVIPMAVLIAGNNIEECAKLGTFGLGFQTMPFVFGQLPFGGFFQTLWFGMLFIAGVTSAISIIQPLISFCEDDLKQSRKGAITSVSVVTFLGGLVGIFGLAAGAVDEFDFWGGSFLLVFIGTIQAFIFSFVLGKRKVKQADGSDESEAFALMNEGAALKLPKFFRFIIRYVCPAYLAIVLVAWLVHDGWAVVSLQGVSPDAMVTFLGHQMSQISFTWGIRIFLLVCTILLNVLIYLAWRKGDPADVPPTTHKQNMPIGDSDDVLSNKKEVK